MRFHAIGLGLCTSWLWLLFLQGPLLEQVSALWGKQAEALFLLFLLFHSIGCGIIGLLLKSRSISAASVKLGLSAACMSILPICIVVIPKWAPQFTDANSWLSYFIAALSGVSAAPQFVAWVERFGKLAIADAAMALACSLCIAGVLTITSVHLPFLIGLGVLVILPPLSLTFMRRVDPAYSQSTVGTSNIPAYRVFPRRLVALIALLYIAGGLMFKTITVEQSFPYFFYISNLAYAAVCIIAGLSLRYRSDLDLRILYRPVLPLVGIGFLVFPLWRGHLAGLSFFLLQSGIAFFDMYTWLLIACLSRGHARPAAVCGYGLGLITFSIFGGDLAYTAITAFTQTLPRLDYLSFGAGIACLLASQFFPEDRETFAGWRTTAALPPENEPNNHPAENSSPVIEEFRLDGPIVLTPREQEILSLLMKGWIQRSIAEKLNISNNTVKFHIHNIYEKCGVSSRQELVKLFDK